MNYDEGIIPDRDEPELQRMCQKLINQLRQSALLRQYLHHVNRGATDPTIHAQNTLPWHAEGERQSAAMCTAFTGIPGGLTPLIGQGGTETPDGIPARFIVAPAAYLIMTAQVYLWSSAMETLADASPLPSHIVSSTLLPYPCMFWSRQVAHHEPEGEYSTNWLCLIGAPTGLRLIHDITKIDNPRNIAVTIAEIPYGRRYPEDFPGQEGVIGAVLKRISFLNSKYVSPYADRIPRSWRREAERNPARYPSGPDPMIRVVKLRRETQEKVDQAQAERADTARKYSGHWWVSGHHRAQWYPSRKEHEVIWIEPYLKGNLSEPELPRIYNVVR